MNEVVLSGKNIDQLVYFHFSGYGTLRSPISILDVDEDESMGEDDFMNVTLVLTDVALGGAYLII